MRIITISREFGSGGRELGKRLSDLLACDYYDREIIAAIAQKSGMDQNYVERTLERPALQNLPHHFRNSFSLAPALKQPQTQLLLAQKQVIEAIAQAGQDCVIVGRNADILLEKYAPFNIFVCAEKNAKMQRCMERAPQGEQLSCRDMERKMRDIDQGRAQIRALVTGKRFGERSAYHLTVNTSGWEIRELTTAVAQFANHWFERKKE